MSLAYNWAKQFLILKREGKTKHQQEPMWSKQPFSLSYVYKNKNIMVTGEQTLHAFEAKISGQIE